MEPKHHHDLSLSDVHESIDTTIPQPSSWRRVFAFFGPAYLISVGYMDPGNWATDLQGGSQFGYKLIWVLLMSNLMALLLQSLSVRLGVVRGRDLAQANRETYPTVINYILYVLAEVAIAACDLAEVLGMAIGLQLLTGIPLLWGVLITVTDTFLLLFLQRLGMRRMEGFIISLIFLIGISFFIELFLAKDRISYGEIASGFIPNIPNNTALYIAIGIIGATVMPHNLYLHSALVQTRKFNRDAKGIKKALRLNFWDSTIALNLAFLVNVAILILAAAVFHSSGRHNVAEIKEAHHLLDQLLGTKIAPILFAVALIAAGQSSTVTGTLAGQVVMEGYLHLRINPWMRRLLTRVIAIIPAVIVILVYGENDVDNLLVFSQVILSLQLSFAIIPLIHFVSDKKTMGSFAIGPVTKIISWAVSLVLAYLNIRMVAVAAYDYFTVTGNLFWKIVILFFGLAFIALLLIAFAYPLFKRMGRTISMRLHHEASNLHTLTIPKYEKIAIAFDFSEKDKALLSHAIGQGNTGSSYILIHVVESVAAKLYRKQSDDMETQKDKEQLEFYSKELNDRGFKAEARLGYGNRIREIVRLVKESNADMLIIGGHRHKGIKDWFYGETINSVRHELNIPVLVVNVK
ncbi:MAG: Nramp family divalent metal transporter [Chitinophagaceae bacterium]|jgi:manganese transport protein|nr:Nramp family divalent metal transporter [Chitinophagaceae bacterium]OQY92679.1 MAG: iron/manganese transporter [Sphingobacteriales bacterium UTBCD1]